MLEKMHDDLFNKAKKARDEHIKKIDNWNDFMAALNKKCICLAPWCNQQSCELKVKERSKEESLKYMEEAGEEEEVLTGSAKTLCIPFEQEPL